MRQRLRTTRSATAVAALAVVMTACASTAQRTTEVAVGGRDAVSAESAADELVLGTTPDSTTEPTSAPSHAGAAGSGPRTPGSPAPTSGVAGAPGGTTQAGPIAQRGFGFDAERLFIGLARTEDAPNPADVFGVEITQAPVEAIQTALVDYYNERGGLAGRTLEPVYHTFDAGGGAPADVQAQAACATYTQDNEVAVTLGLGGDVFLGCMADRGIPSISAGYFTGADDYFDRFPLYLNLTAFNYTRMAETLVDGLAATGYFEGAGRIGLSSIDSPGWDRAIDFGLRPALARHGLPEPLVCSVRERKSEADLAGAAGDLSACLLRFQTENITHVMFLAPENGGAQELLFMQQADGQGYRPRYGLQSSSLPYIQAENLPPSQLRGALGTGWLPIIDVNEPAQRPAPNDSARRCHSIIKDAGIAASTSPADEGVRLQVCEVFFLLEAMVTASGGNLDPGALVAGAESLGTDNPWANGFGARLAPDQHDGVVAYRPFAYVDGCSCFRYTGPVTRTS